MEVRDSALEEWERVKAPTSEVNREYQMEQIERDLVRFALSLAPLLHGFLGAFVRLAVVTVCTFTGGTCFFGLMSSSIVLLVASATRNSLVRCAWRRYTGQTYQAW